MSWNLFVLYLWAWALKSGVSAIAIFDPMIVQIVGHVYSSVWVIHVAVEIIYHYWPKH